MATSFTKPGIEHLILSYLSLHNVRENETVNKLTLFLALKKNKGVTHWEFNNAIEYMKNLGLISTKNHFLKLTAKGFSRL